MKPITIIDASYSQWIEQLSQRYRRSQIKAALKVNSEMIAFYWSLGRDIVQMQFYNKYGSGFYRNLSSDLAKLLPDVEGLSERNIRYMKSFYVLYCQKTEILPQLGAESDSENLPQLGAELTRIPWGHHRLIIDHCKGDTDKAVFYVHKILQEDWSRAMLLNFIDTGLYERDNKALNNFQNALPAPMSDLAQEITKDPYNFAFAGITGKYNEALLKKALVQNITDFF